MVDPCSTRFAYYMAIYVSIDCMGNVSDDNIKNLLQYLLVAGNIYDVDGF